jgi:predicted short-subunit dehydrogenase-like oxidoreductase (DUF2520 family)
VAYGEDEGLRPRSRNEGADLTGSPPSAHPGLAVPGQRCGPVVILGRGRMGRGLAGALEGVGESVRVLGRDRSVSEIQAAALVLIATPDDAIGAVAAELARERAITARQVVLHLSGLLDRLALHALASSGAALGSFHPLQSVADPLTAPERLRGAFAGVEGDEAAVQAAERLAARLGMTPVRLAAGAKAASHAGAVMASNYLVVLAAVAEQLARSAGVPDSHASALYLPLMQGTVANLALGPAAALGLARRAGLGEAAAAAVERARSDPPGA